MAGAEGSKLNSLEADFFTAVPAACGSPANHMYVQIESIPRTRTSGVQPPRSLTRATYGIFLDLCPSYGFQVPW